MQLSRLPVLLACAAFCLTAGAAFAQAEGAPDATPEQEEAEAEAQAEEEAEAPPGGAEEMVITARKREENLQEVPVAVTALGGETLEGLGVMQTDDISALAPNLYFTQTPGSSANSAVSIRGVGGAEPLLTRDAPVPIYVDGAYVARRTGAVFELLELERIEVLRGPQGTLYGRNATGGAINYISRRPSEDVGFKQELTFGNLDHFVTRSVLNTGNLGDTGLAATFSVLHKERDGYVDDRNRGDERDPGAYDTEAFRIAVNWEATESFNAFYAFDYQDISGQDPYFQLLEINPAVLAALHPTSTTPKAEHNRDNVANLDFHDLSSHHVQGHNLTLEGDLGFATLKSISTFREWDNDEEGTELDGHAGLVANVFGAPVPVQLFAAVNERDQHQFSQELQLLGDIGERIEYVTGAYYFTESFNENNPQQFMVTSLASPMIPPGFGVPVSSDLEYDGDSKSWAVFGNGTWTPPILDDNLQLTAGARYTRDDREFEQFAPVAIENQEKFRNVDWVFEAAYAFTEDLNGYGRVATGYLSGGFNPRAGTPTPFDEETLLSYELGLKTRWLEDRLQLNGAVFYSKYDDLQVDRFVSGAMGATSVTENAGEATMWGAELEALLQFTDNISGYLNYGYLHPEYREFEILDLGSGMEVNIADDARFGYRPEHTLAAGLEFVSDPFSRWNLLLSARVDGRYVDDLWWFAIDNAPSGFPITPFNEDIKEDGYGVVDVAVSLSEIPVAIAGSESNLKFTLWGRNVTDEEYRRSGIDFGALGFAGAIYGEPATYGLTMTFEY